MERRPPDRPRSDWVLVMNAQSIAFVIALDPMGAMRPRTAVRGRHATVYTDPKMASWKAEAVAQLRGRGWAEWKHEAGEALKADVVCVFKRPKSRKKDVWHVVKPDGDNCEKLVWDSLVDAGVLADDCSIAWGTVKKRYQHLGEEDLDPVGVRVFLSKLTDEALQETYRLADWFEEIRKQREESEEAC